MTQGTYDHHSLVDGAHVVHFYETDEGLVSTIGNHLIGAARAGDGIVLIATADHRRHFADVLQRAGVDVNTAVGEGRIVLVDPHDVITAVCRDGVVDAARFDAVVATALHDAAQAAGGRRVHAYGEMVAVLWADGDVSGAIALEQLWNELAREEGFTLFCGYPQTLFLDLAAAERFADLCETHSHVLGGAPVPSDAEVARHFPTTLVAPRLARRFVVETLRQWGLVRVIDEAMLIVSELATNAVLYGATSFVVALTRHGDTLRVAVSDPLPAPPVVRRPSDGDTSGRGLRLVATLGESWGHDRTAEGKLVWAEMRLRADE